MMKRYLFECLPANGATSYVELVIGEGVNVRAAAEECRSRGYYPIRVIWT